MRTATAALLVGGGAALAACTDPSLAVDVRHTDPALRDRLASLTLSVVELPPHPDGSPIACEEVRYGRISADRLDGGRRSSASAGATLTGVPRLGDKLVLLEGRDRGGDRIAGGCEPLGDVTVDTTLTIDAELAPRVRELSGLNGLTRDPSSPPDDFVVAAARPWRDEGNVLAGVGGVAIEVDLRDRAADRERIARVTTCGAPGPDCAADAVTGLATVPLSSVKGSLSPALAPGPVELIVRAPWQEAPVTVRAFEPLTPIMRASVSLAPVGMLRAENLAAPSWVFARPDGLRAAALFVTDEPSRTYRIVLVDSQSNQLALRRREILSPEPVHALVAWRNGFWTRTRSGWIRIDFAAGTLTPAIGDAGEAATELLAIEPCGGNGPEGILARSGSGPYVAYDGPAQRHGGGGELGELVAEVNRITFGRAVADLCLSYSAGVRRTVVVRGELGPAPLATYLVPSGVGAPILPSPIAAGFVGYQQGSWRLGGATLDVTGPRLASYLLAAQQPLDDQRLEGELVSLPAATAVGDLDRDGELDIVATAHEIVDQSRVQVTYQFGDGRAPLTGLSPAFDGTAPLVSIDRFDALALDVATVATSRQLTIFALGAP
jgi:hypothetical protein